MSHLTTIVKKEVRELLTPGSVISVLVMVGLFAVLGGLIGEEVSKSTVMPVVGVANDEAQTIVTEAGEWNAYDFLIDFYINSGDKRITPENVKEFVIRMDESDILEQMESSGASVALVLSKDFKKNIEDSLKGLDSDSKTYSKGEIFQYYVYQPSGMIGGTVSSTVGSAIVSNMNSSLSKFITGEEESKYVDFLKYPIKSSGTYTYVNGELRPGVTPSEISSAMSGQTVFVPMIIMIIIMMVGSIVISSMGSEKENKTLETLLTLPISRTVIVTGKIIAAALVGLIFGLAYMFGMAFYVSSITFMSIGDSGLDLESLGLALGITDYALVALSMFLSIACALGICMILGAFAKNYKSAQTMTMPLSILAILPMFIVMFSGWYSSNALIQTVLFIIPFSHPMMATEALMNGDITLVLAGIVYMAVFALVSILITVRLYRSDILVTGLSQNKYVEMLRGRGRRSRAKNRRDHFYRWCRILGKESDMNNRSKVIVAVGSAAILISIGIFVVLYVNYQQCITFVTDPDNLAQYFVVVDDDSGETSPVEKGAKVFEKSTIRSNSEAITWLGDPVVSLDSMTVRCKCTVLGESKQILIWIHGADLLGAELIDGALCVHVTDTYYNFALAIKYDNQQRGPAFYL